MNGNNQDLAASPNLAEDKKRLLVNLIPEAFSEGNLVIAALKRALGDTNVVENGERYALTWAGKSDAYKVLQSPTTATLRPQRELSVNFDEAQHVFVEGENLEALKVLQKAYFGKVKLIYIDPPYNTGSDDFDNLTWPHFDALIWPHLSLMFNPGDLAASGMCTKNVSLRHRGGASGFLSIPR